MKRILFSLVLCFVSVVGFAYKKYIYDKDSLTFTTKINNMTIIRADNSKTNNILTSDCYVTLQYIKDSKNNNQQVSYIIIDESNNIIAKNVIKNNCDVYVIVDNYNNIKDIDIEFKSGNIQCLYIFNRERDNNLDAFIVYFN